MGESGAVTMIGREWFTRKRVWIALLFIAWAGAMRGQVSGSAYRVVGQPDLLQNGVNRVQGIELFSPSALALDPRGGQVHVYVSDTSNSRVLGWPDVRSYQNGDSPAVILGQPNPLSSTSYGIGAKGFNTPLGLAVDPTTGNLYVADLGNNRILRFPSPFANPTRVEPSAVYGQPDFNARTANTGGISKHSLNQPRSLTFDNS